jgi:hypothetical protein
MTTPARARWWVVAVLLAVLAVFVPCTINGARWIGRPFPGFLVLANGIVVSMGRSDWAGLGRRRTQWTRLLSVDGETVGSGRELHRVLQRADLARPLAYTFRQGTEVFRLALQARPFGIGDFLGVFAPMLGIGLLVILTGAFVVMRRPEAPETRALFVVCLSLGLAAITGPDQYFPCWFVPLFFLSAAAVAPAFVQLALVYPQRSRLLRRARLLYAGLYLPFFGLAAGIVAAMPEPALFLPLLYLLYFLVANSALMYVGRLVLALIEGVRPARPIVLALAAVVGSSLIAAAILVTYPLLKQPISPVWMLGPLLLFPALTGVAFLRFPQPRLPEAEASRTAA